MSTRDLWRHFIRSSSCDQTSSVGSETKRLKNCLRNDSEGTSVKEFYERIISSTPQSVVTPTIPPQQQNSVNIKTEKSQRDKVAIPSAHKFFQSADTGDVDTLKRFVKFGGNVNVRDEFGWTALMCSTASGQTDCVAYLLSVGADKNVKDKSYSSVWTLAKKFRQKEILELLKNSEKPKPVKNRSDIGMEERSCNQSFYCEDCKEHFLMDESLHRKSTGHLLCQKPNCNSYTPYHIGENNVGFQLLLKSGWDKEKGLGPDGSGIKVPIKTVLKRNRKGFGLDKNVKPRITHFAAGSELAVKFEREGEEFKVPNRKMRERQKTIEKWKEIEFRRMFYDFD